MKVVHINAVYNQSSSTGRMVYQLKSFGEKINHKVSVITSKIDLQANGVYCFNSKFDLKKHALLSRIWGRQAYFSNCATKKMLVFLKNDKPDIVHLHNLHGNYINIKILFNFLAKENIATVLTLHDCFFFTGKCCHYSTKNCYKWQNDCKNCQFKKSDNPSFFFDWAKQNLADKKKWFKTIDKLAVIGVSKWITSETKKSILKDANFIETIYNWIDLEVFSAHESNLKNELNLTDKFTILCFADKFNNDLTTVKKVLSDLKADQQLLVIGNVIEELKNHPQITTIPYQTSPEKLAEVYSISDCFLNLSYEDAFGLVTAEAMACGTPVIAYNNGTATPELITEECGYLVPLCDSKKIIEAINIVHQNGKVIYSNYCRSFTEKNFSQKQQLTAYYKLYQKLLQD